MFKRYSIQTADGSIIPFKDFAILIIMVDNVFGKTHAFFRPELPGTSNSTSLFLGLPWLYSIDAEIKIREFTIILEDPNNSVRKVKERITIKCRNGGLAQIINSY